MNIMTLNVGFMQKEDYGQIEEEKLSINSN